MDKNSTTSDEIEKIEEWIGIKRQIVFEARCKFIETADPKSLDGIGLLCERIVVAQKFVTEQRIKLSQDASSL